MSIFSGAVVIVRDVRVTLVDRIVDRTLVSDQQLGFMFSSVHPCIPLQTQHVTHDVQTVSLLLGNRPQQCCLLPPRGVHDHRQWFQQFQQSAVVSTVYC